QSRLAEWRPFQCRHNRIDVPCFSPRAGHSGEDSGGRRKETCIWLSYLRHAFRRSKIPFAIFSESVHANEFVLRLRRRMMIFPRIFLIDDRTPLSDQFLCKSERVLI